MVTLDSLGVILEDIQEEQGSNHTGNQGLSSSPKMYIKCTHYLL